MPTREVAFDVIALFTIAGLSFNAELLGIGRGKDALPSTVLAPPSVFPPLAVKAKQPIKNDESEYLLSLSKEFRFMFEALFSSDYFLQHPRTLGYLRIAYL